MKKINFIKIKSTFIMGLVAIGCIVNAQVAIGKESADGDGILDFSENLNAGIILPITSQLPSNASEGTILVDGQTATVKVYDGENWISLTDSGKLPTSSSNTSNDNGEGIIIGSETSEADGVLVLESENKALILPKVNDPVSQIKSPQIGTLCYDTKSNTLAIFDGNNWSFWK